MGKIDPTDTLARAQEAFLGGHFDLALRLYSHVMSLFPRLREARVGVMLSDVAMQHPSEAAALFDFYQLIKDQNGAEALIEEVTDALVALGDKNATRAAEALAAAESADGIGYGDFLALVEKNGNFKETFEDILFSTKVIITSKAEFIDFVTRLAKEGMVETALRYLDASSGVFGNDQEVLALYHMVEGAEA